MTRSELEEIKSLGRWPVKASDFYRYYFFAVFPVMFILLGASVLYSGEINNLFDLRALGVAFITGGGLVLFVVIRRLIRNQTLKIIK